MLLGGPFKGVSEGRDRMADGYSPVGALPRARLALVHHVGDKIVDVCVVALRPRHQLAQVDVLDGEVDDGGVLLDEKGVLGEALDVQDQVRGQGGQLEPLERRVLVGAVLLLAGAVELGQDREQGHLHGAREPAV